MASLNVAIVRDHTVNIEVVKDFEAAMEAAALKRGAVDHGMIRMGDVKVGIVVWEFSLFEHPAKTHYWAIGKSLYAGNAVMYKVDEEGETVDLPAADLPPIKFFKGADDVMYAIQMGQIERPETSINGHVTWQWPNQNAMYDREGIAKERK